MTEQEKLIAIARTSTNANAILIELFNGLKKQIDSLQQQISKELPEDKKIENIAMKLAVRLIDIQKGDDGKTPTEEELVALIKPLIPTVEDGKTPTNEELLALIRPLILQIKDGATPTKEELIALITPLIPPAVPGKDGSPDSPEQVRDKLETLQGEERLDASAIKNLPELIKASESPRAIFGSAKTKVIVLDLSAQLNGVLKTFNIGTHYGIISVNSSSAPFGAFRPIVDYNEVGKTIVFTSNVDAAVSLATGQSLIIQYLR